MWRNPCLVLLVQKVLEDRVDYHSCLLGISSEQTRPNSSPGLSRSRPHLTWAWGSVDSQCMHIAGRQEAGRQKYVHTYTDKADSKAGRDGGHVERGQTTQAGGKLIEGLAGTGLSLLWGLVWEPDGAQININTKPPLNQMEWGAVGGASSPNKAISPSQGEQPREVTMTPSADIYGVPTTCQALLPGSHTDGPISSTHGIFMTPFCK